MKNVFYDVDFSLSKIMGPFFLRHHKGLTSSYVMSDNGNMWRHPSKDAISVSVRISSDIGTLVTQRLYTQVLIIVDFF